MRHRELVLDHQQSVQEGALLEVEGQVQGRQVWKMGVDLLEPPPWAGRGHLRPRVVRERTPPGVVVEQPTPIAVVGVSERGSVAGLLNEGVAPRISRKQLVAARAG